MENSEITIREQGDKILILYPEKCKLTATFFLLYLQQETQKQIELIRNEEGR